MSTGSQTLPADFAIVIRTQSDMGSQTPLYKKKEGKLRLKLSLKCQILENELEQMKERIFYVLFLFYFNAMSASLEKDKQLLNGLPVEIKATNQDPSSLPPAPPVLIIEKDRKEYELLEGVIQRLTAERDESKTSLSALVRQYDLVEDYRKRELANLTQRADLSEMALFNYHQRFVLLSNELETTSCVCFLQV